jgi:hypothetical protein
MERNEAQRSQIEAKLKRNEAKMKHNKKFSF